MDTDTMSVTIGMNHRNRTTERPGILLFSSTASAVDEMVTRTTNSIV
jgi:hypothetical protein